MKMLIWMTQLGLSLVIPLTCFSLLGVWLHMSLGWGKWAVAAGILLGLLSGGQSLRNAIGIMSRMEKPEKKDLPQSFNDHI